MTMWWRRALVTMLAGSLVVLAACSDEDTADNEDTPDAGEGDVAQNDADEYVPGDVDFESEYQLILNEFAFDPDSPGGDGMLNNLIDYFIRDQTLSTPIIVLVELTEIDTDAEEMMIRAGAGLHAGDPGGGEYVWDDELEEPDSTYGTFDEDGYLEAELELLNFVATVETDEETMKTIIPIRDIELDGVLRAEEDGSEPHIVDADLEGIIWYDEAQDIELALEPGGDAIPLVSDSILSEEDMNYIYDPDDEGIEEENAWKMSATFSAEETVIVD